MKRLRKLALNLDRHCWPNEYGYGFYLRSRSLCNFIERALKSEVVSVVDSTKLVIIGRPSQHVGFEINSSEIAGLYVPFEPVEYDGLTANRDVNAFMVKFLQEKLGSLPCPPCNSPDALLALAERFAETDYQNNWVHARKKLPALAATAVLHCDLTPDAFTLSLLVESKGDLIYRSRILQTEPDEIAFHYQFRDLVVDGNELVVTSRLEAPLVRVPMAEFGR